MIGLVLSAVISIGVALLLRRLSKKNKELAKLRTEAQLAELDATLKERNAAIAPLGARLGGLQLEAAQQKRAAVAFERKLQQAQKEHDRRLQRVSVLSNWNELDAYNKEGR